MQLRVASQADVDARLAPEQAETVPDVDPSDRSYEACNALDLKARGHGNVSGGGANARPDVDKRQHLVLWAIVRKVPVEAITSGGAQRVGKHLVAVGHPSSGGIGAVPLARWRNRQSEVQFFERLVQLQVGPHQLQNTAFLVEDAAHRHVPGAVSVARPGPGSDEKDVPSHARGIADRRGPPRDHRTRTFNNDCHVAATSQAVDAADTLLQIRRKDLRPAPVWTRRRLKADAATIGPCEHS
mmetsp:Transcript_20147/g.55765  ORF Transcript_20147/g.55765 Transcript_20147/m.55765 type:complete len:241 (+) Transcript_20147:908-1630(+)